MALDSGASWHAVSQKTRIPYATVKKHARAMGYAPRRRSTGAANFVHGRGLTFSAFMSPMSAC
jgi:hypothetical protein